MKPIKLAWDNCFARRNPTGTGIYAARLLEQLQENSDVVVTAFEGWPDGTRGGSYPRRVLKILGNMAWTHLDLPFRLWKGSFDVLHSPAFVAPAKSICPVVITVHDITYLRYPMHFAPWWVHYMKSIMPIAIRSAAAIICPSKHSKSDVVTAYNLSPEKVHVVLQGVDHKSFHPGEVLDAAWAQSVGITKQYVLHVGGFYERKNVPTLLRAIAHLQALGKWQDRQLVLAGAPAPGIKGANEIHKTIAELKLSDSVVLPGRVSEEHLPGLYATAALVVMPSLYEGFGFPVLEAMASGTPVVASNTSSLPEVAGEAAILVPPHDTTALADAITMILSRQNLADDLRAKGLVQAQQFNWQRTAAETVAVYRGITG